MIAPLADYWRLRPRAPESGTILGPIDDLPNGGAREYTYGRGPSAFRMFVVRRGEMVRAYLNICPHFSLPLNQAPDQFLSPDGQTLRCSQHFAEFDIESGRCLAGACLGSHLDAIPVHIDEDRNLRIGCGDRMPQPQ